MRVVVQRSKQASVRVDGQIVGEIEHGLVLLVGIKSTDGLIDSEYLAEKVAHLRIFEDESGKMNLDIQQTGGAILSVSQFTLYGDARKGRRPNYLHAATPDIAEPLYNMFNDQLRNYGLMVQTGVFGAMMDVKLTNDGPVTVLLDSERHF